MGFGHVEFGDWPFGLLNKFYSVADTANHGGICIIFFSARYMAELLAARQKSPIRSSSSLLYQDSIVVFLLHLPLYTAHLTVTWIVI